MHRWIGLAGLALLLVGCRGGGEAPSDAAPTSRPRPPSSPAVSEATWASWAGPCKTDDECTGVADECCACGARSYRPVTKLHEAEAAKSASREDCKCPQQHCNRIVFHCRSESCAVEEN